MAACIEVESIAQRQRSRVARTIRVWSTACPARRDTRSGVVSVLFASLSNQIAARFCPAIGLIIPGSTLAEAEICNHTSHASIGCLDPELEYPKSS